MMLPAAVGMPMPRGASGVVYCTTCFPREGFIAPGRLTFEKVRDASRAAGVVDVPGELGAGHLGPAGRLALHHAICGELGKARRKRSTFALLKALALVDKDGEPTEEGRALAARIGLSADDPPRPASVEQHALPIDLSCRQRPISPLMVTPPAPVILAEPPPAPAVEARSPWRWVGGKGALLPEIMAAMPENFGRLFVPFAGGGALVFEMAGRVAYVSDANAHLINSYVAIRDRVEDLILALEDHKNDRDYYDAVVESFNDGYGDELWRAAAFLYMNKVGFNGLCRYNLKGGYNVPFGDNPKAKICDADNLRACSEALRGVEIVADDFREVEARVQPGDCLYLDPPYLPESKTASFTGYWGKWGNDEHEACAALFRRLVARGVHVLVSNSDTPRARELYAGFEIRTLYRSNSVNSKASARGGKPEILVLGGTWTPKETT